MTPRGKQLIEHVVKYTESVRRESEARRSASVRWLTAGFHLVWSALEYQDIRLNRVVEPLRDNTWDIVFALLLFVMGIGMVVTAFKLDAKARREQEERETEQKAIKSHLRNFRGDPPDVT